MSRYFPPGPPLRGWRPPAPYPEVYLPHHEPYFYSPFMPYFVAPNYVPPYMGRKDMRALEGLGSRSLVPVASSAPDRGQSSYAQYLDRQRSTVREAWWDDDFDDDLFGEEDADLLGLDEEDFGFGADDSSKKRPFKAISDLFRRDPSKGKSKAQELIDAAAVLSQQPTTPQLPPLQTQAPAPAWSTSAKVAAGVGVAAILITVGVFAGRALQAR